MSEHTEKNSNKLSAHSIAEIEKYVAKYPADQKRSAVLSALQVAQHQNHGYLTKALMDDIAKQLDLPPVQVYEVATFYSMFETKPCGRLHVSVCTNISCMLMGSDNILAHVEKKLGIKMGESTPDGKFYLKKEEECLAACAGGPMMMIDHHYYESLTPEKIDAILDGID
ncbi:MAG: NADH-quinone oxidoreductase subunit NuoE [Gammaproteobacteria bacterium]|nr:NADH-quinone oxidoreductase subunit NuoE [Gammaproteobacteria bacterium]NNC97039.1 NADH-quinone oxidoreductase subunit NuoE [Gammaproteobacteria bacterium]NNM13855.1 NADH-quinone oxidoreductase subunit NuoE [Gammaproteobacteria bacterium]